MGMFDEVVCKYSLPGEPPPQIADAVFQTKDLECLLLTYTITADGFLMEQSGEPSVFTGAVDMYWSNLVASGPGIYTRDGEDYRSVEYRVTFVSGKVTSIEETENKTQRAAKYKPFHLDLPSEEERAATLARQQESLLGKTLFVQWGGSEGYLAMVVAESDKELVVQKPDKRFEIIHRTDRDRIFFDSPEDAKRFNDEKSAEWERRRLEYEQEIAEKSDTANLNL